MNTDKGNNNEEIKHTGTKINYIIHGRKEVRSMDDLLDSLVGNKSNNNKAKVKKTKEEDFGIYNKGSNKYNKDTINKGKAEFKKRKKTQTIQRILIHRRKNQKRNSSPRKRTKKSLWRIFLIPPQMNNSKNFFPNLGLS